MRTDLVTDAALDEKIITDQFKDVAERTGLLQSSAGKLTNSAKSQEICLTRTSKKFSATIAALTISNSPMGRALIQFRPTTKSNTQSAEATIRANHSKFATFSKKFTTWRATKSNIQTHSAHLLLEKLRADDDSFLLKRLFKGLGR
ncbi:MAG: hypothetical protein II857_02315 [Selenomonadaceae bacterium]|nr:hypothetical protein [Selenomonadaceae bacterium]